MELKNFWFHNEAIPKQIDPLIRRRVLAHHEALMIVEVEFQTGGIGTLHGHRHEQVTYVLSGRFEFTINGVSRIVQAGDSLFMEKDVIHGTLCLESGTLLDIFTPHREDFIEGN